MRFVLFLLVLSPSCSNEILFLYSAYTYKLQSNWCIHRRTTCS